MAHAKSKNKTPVNPVAVALAELQNHFALCSLKEVRGIKLEQLTALTEAGCTESLTLYTRDSFDILLKRKLETLDIPLQPKDIAETVKRFWIDPKTKMYDRIVFSPHKEPENVLNLWQDCPYKGKKGDWNQLSRFIFEVICDEDAEAYTYLLNFIAHMLQRPEEKPGVMIFMIGEQGTGKGAFFGLLKAIWPNTTLFIQDARGITEGFNASLERSFVVELDEALFIGDRRSNDRLKSMVTEPLISIEEKYQPKRTMPSYHRYFAASNHDHVMQVEANDRRYTFLKVSSRYRGNSEYYGKVFASINDPMVIEAMVYDLRQRDLSNYNARKKLQTHQTVEQQRKSLGGFERAWHEFLCTGTIPDSFDYGEDTPFQQGQFVASQALEAACRRHDPQGGRYAPMQARELMKKVRHLCPSALTNVRRAKKRGIELPSLKTARLEFNTATGIDVPWLSDMGVVPHEQIEERVTEQDTMNFEADADNCPF